MLNLSNLNGYGVPLIPKQFAVREQFNKTATTKKKNTTDMLDVGKEEKKLDNNDFVDSIELAGNALFGNRGMGLHSISMNTRLIDRELVTSYFNIWTKKKIKPNIKPIILKAENI